MHTSVDDASGEDDVCDGDDGGETEGDEGEGPVPAVGSVMRGEDDVSGSKAGHGNRSHVGRLQQ